MLESIIAHMEAEAAARGRSALPQLAFYRARNAAHWVLVVVGIAAAFAFELSARTQGHVLLVVLRSASVMSITVTAVVRTNPEVLNKLVLVYVHASSALEARRTRDFFFAHYWVLLTTFFLVTMTMAVSTLRSPATWLLPATDEYKKIQAPLQQLITFGIALITAQIAVFNFMFTQLLGRYSSTLVQTINRHRAVLLVRATALLSVLVLFWFYLRGVPVGVANHIGALVVLLSVCVSVTLWMGNTGVNATAALKYAGVHIANKVRHHLKPPADPSNKWWKFMASVGLDWRNPSRLVASVPPPKAIALLMGPMAGLLNAAQRAVTENQHENLVAALDAVHSVGREYANGRRQYMGSEDAVFEYVNNQLASLVKTASASANQSLVTTIVTYEAQIGSSALLIGEGPDFLRTKDEEAYARVTHVQYTKWAWSLREAFEATHSLTRSTAASEAIGQLAGLSQAALRRGYSESGIDLFLDQLAAIHSTCLAKPDAYRLGLSAECFQAALRVWHTTTELTDEHAVASETRFAEQLTEMATRHHAVQRMPALDLRDIANVITTKLFPNQPILQEIVAALLSGKTAHAWQARARVESVSRIISMLTELALDAVNKHCMFAPNYVEALYETSIIVFMGVPPALSKAVRSETDNDTVYMSRWDPDAILTAEIASSVEKISSPFLVTGNYSHRTRDMIASIIALACAEFSESKREGSMAIAAGAVEFLISHLEAATEQGKSSTTEWQYLRLMGSWIHRVAPDQALDRRVIDFIARRQPRRVVQRMSGLHRGLDNYPSNHIGGRWAVKNPSNIERLLTATGKGTLTNWVNIVLDPANFQAYDAEIAKSRQSSVSTDSPNSENATDTFNGPSAE